MDTIEVKKTTKSKRKDLTMFSIVRIVSKHSGIPYSEIIEGKSIRRLMPAKCVSIYFMRHFVKYTGRYKGNSGIMPLTKIGHYMKRDHTAIIYALNLLKDMRDVEEKCFVELFNAVNEDITNRVTELIIIE